MTDPIWALPTDRLDVELVKLPSVVTWSRLEPLSLTAELTPGLQALLADPLWLLGRQWQFGELRGEDAGTPISAIVEVEQAPIGRLRPGAEGEPVDIVDEAVPLEARIEAEWVAMPAIRIRAEAGLQLLRRLTAAGLGTDGLRTDVLARWAFAPIAAVDPVDPVDPAPALPDPTGDALAAVYAGRIPDAARVAADLGPLAGAGGGPLDGLPAGLVVPPESAETARGVLGEWLAWYRGYLFQAGGSEQSSWNPFRQEHTFALQADLGSGRTVLEAAEYAGGPFDWPDVDATIGDLGPSPADRQGVLTRQVRLPTPATFPGMPADRLWQFEDSRVYLGGIEAGPTDLARMALVEFALAYGVDWFALPVEVPAGSVYWVHQLDVVDTFGRSASLGSAREPGGWSMFGLAAPGEQTFVADALFVPAVSPLVLRSDPLEEVALFRDEMANLVWGVERVVQAPSGQPVNRARLAPKVSLRQQLPDDLGDAAIVYRLMTPVPDHWVPFVAVPARAGGGIELERRPLLHFRGDGTTDVTHPLGTLLFTAPGAPPTDRLRVAEEEVPRDGAVVTRRYQLARTPDGGTTLWIGRRKTVGQGEGWSGLRFDTALPPGALH